MLPSEIQAFASRVGNDKQFAGKKVLIKAPADKGGKYLGYSGQFDADKENAVRYDYTRHRVGDQIQQLDEMGMKVIIELA